MRARKKRIAGGIQALCLSLLLLSFGSKVLAQATTTEREFDFNIPQQLVSTALIEFAEQADLTLVFSNDLVRDKFADALRGSYSLQRGIDALLAGTGLAAKFSRGVVLRILKTDEADDTDEADNRGKTMKQKVGLIAAVAAALFGGTATAQDTASNKTEHGVGVLEEIVVTAQKRSQSLMDVGISVSVAGEQEIKDRRLNMITDVGMFAPNVSVKENIPGLMPIITVRGVGLNDFNAANNPATGVYIDELSLSSLALLSSDFFDLQQMEVLKGPQGTLYGRNSTAGALNIVTAKPNRDEQSGRLSLGAANYDTLELEGMSNVPVSDTVAIRIAGKSIQQNEGYFTDGGTNVGERDITMVRGQFLWMPSDTTTVLFKLEQQDADSELGIPKYFGAVPTPTEANCPGQPGCSNFIGYSDPSDDPYSGTYSIDPDYELDQFISTLRVDADLSFGTLTSVTGYIDFDRLYAADVDASPDPIMDFNNTDEVEQLSQELRLAGEKGNLVWQIGAFYSKDKIRTTYAGDFRTLLNTTAFSAADIEATSKAVFANIEWAFNEDMTLILGLRATDEDKSNFGFTDDLATEAPFSFVSGTPVGLGPVRLAEVDDSIDDTSVDWKIGLNWNLNSALLYASASQGTKSGGFFTGVVTSDQQLIPYDAEVLTAFEVGAKGQLSDYGLSYEASVFYYDYEDVQTFISDSSGAVQISRLSNVKGATIFGVDLMSRWNSQSIDGLSALLGIGILDTELESFVAGTGVIPKGNEQPDAPEFSANVEVQYAFNLTDTIPASIAVDGRFQSEAYHDSLNLPLSESDDYWVVNARISAYFGADWEVIAWGRNLADKEYMVQMSDNLALGNGTRVFGPPRTYGVTVTKHFN